MRKASLFTSILLLAATMAVAQQSNPSSTPTSQDQSAISTQSTIQGCLSGTESNYTVTDQKSGITYKLSGSNDPLKAHVGHLIQLTGSTSNDSGSTFKFDSVKMISSDCSASTTPSSTDASAVAPSTTVPADQTPAATTTVPADQTAAPMAQPTTALPQSDQPAAAPAPAPIAPAPDMSAQTTTAPATTTETQAAPATTTTVSDSDNKLPQTASPLPLLGLLGFGSLLSGFWARFKK
jgi:hypothetical protein